jgi:hypothetical protein
VIKCGCIGLIARNSSTTSARHVTGDGHTAHPLPPGSLRFCRRRHSFPPSAPPTNISYRSATSTDAHCQFISRGHVSHQSLIPTSPVLPPSLPSTLRSMPPPARTNEEKDGHDDAGGPHIKNAGRGMALPGVHDGGWGGLGHLASRSC